MTASGLPWLSRHGDDVLLDVRVQPRASRQGITGTRGDRLKVALHSPPEKGKANRELERLIASTLGLPAGAVAVVAGQTSREKRLCLAGAGDLLGRIESRLRPLAEE